MSKVALITGVTGKICGSYLAEFLLEKGYEVHGIKCYAHRHSTPRARVDHIYQDSAHM